MAFSIGLDQVHAEVLSTLVGLCQNLNVLGAEISQTKIQKPFGLGHVTLNEAKVASSAPRFESVPREFQREVSTFSPVFA